MGTIRIAHISDPHFGSSLQLPVWLDACKYLNETLKPHLVLVTGDIVHTPDKHLYKYAKTELDKLKTIGANPTTSYIVCAGNHDRHPYGNAPGPLQKAWELATSRRKIGLSALWSTVLGDAKPAGDDRRGLPSVAMLE